MGHSLALRMLMQGEACLAPTKERFFAARMGLGSWIHVLCRKSSPAMTRYRPRGRQPPRMPGRPVVERGPGR